MTNHDVWAGVAWSLYVFAIVQGAYRASGINQTATLTVTSASHAVLLVLLGAVLMDSTSQFASFMSALLTGVVALMVIGGGLFILRRKLEWNETLAAVRARATLSAGLTGQASTPSQHHPIADGPLAASVPADLPVRTTSSN